MGRLLPRRLRRIGPTAGIVALLLVASGCYYEPVDNTPPYSVVSDTTSAKTYTTSWYNDGPTYGCTSSTVNGSTTTTCSQDQLRDWQTTRTLVERYYIWIYRHVNDFGGSTTSCDAWYQSDTLGNDGQPVAPVADGQWYVTYAWTTAEYSGMHGCGGHGTGWRRHMESRAVHEIRRTTTTNRTGSDARTIQVSTVVAATATTAPVARPT